MQGRQNRVPVPNQNWSSSGGMGRGSVSRVTSNRGRDGTQHQKTGPELFVPEHPEDKASASSQDSSIWLKGTVEDGRAASAKCIFAASCSECFPCINLVNAHNSVGLIPLAHLTNEKPEVKRSDTRQFVSDGAKPALKIMAHNRCSVNTVERRI